MAQATALDFRLRDFLNEFRPQVDGLIQLRIYLSGPGLQPDPSANYPATDIRVTGDTWAVVRGASVPCSKGSAKDSEALTSAQRNGQGSASPNEGSAKSSAGGASTAPGASPSASAADTSGGSAAGTSGESGASPLARDGESAKGSESSSNRGVIVAVVVIVVAGGALAAAFLLARRRRAG